jgi:ubiquinone/menaquinone biosynthesis C-methylase UbiE
MTAGMTAYDRGASDYDRFTGRWSSLYVPCLVAAAGVSEGDSVLDVAAGTGWAALGLGSRVGAQGRVLAVDLAPAMLRMAAAKLAGLSVRLALMDGQRLACRSAVFDAVVCQLGLMFFPEPRRGLEEFRRVLRCGGRVAVQVWSRPARAPFFGILADAMSGAFPEEQRAELYQPSALGDPDRLRGLLSGAGFRDVSVTAERRRVSYESFDEYWEPIERGGSRLGQFYLGLPGRQRRMVRQQVLDRMSAFRSGSRLDLEAEAFVGRGVKADAGDGAEGR